MADKKINMDNFADVLADKIENVMYCAYEESGKNGKISALLLREAAIMMQGFEEYLEEEAEE